MRKQTPAFLPLRLNLGVLVKERSADSLLRDELPLVSQSADKAVHAPFQQRGFCVGFGAFAPSPRLLASIVAHIHEKIDFTVCVFVVRDGKVLLIHHRKLDKWLPLGGHVELDEDPEQAALREAKEESGLEVELLGERPPTAGQGTRALIAPRFLDIHRITETHEHIGMIYWARPKNGTMTLAAEEHHDIRWCSAGELEGLQPAMSVAIRWYCLKALEEVR